MLPGPSGSSHWVEERRVGIKATKTARRRIRAEPPRSLAEGARARGYDKRARACLQRVIDVTKAAEALFAEYLLAPAFKSTRSRST